MGWAGEGQERREGREHRRGGVGLPRALPFALAVQNGFSGGGLDKVGPRGVSQGNCPKDAQAPRAECVPAEAGPPPSAALWPEPSRAMHRGSWELVPWQGHEPWSQGPPGPLTLAFL